MTTAITIHSGLSAHQLLPIFLRPPLLRICANAPWHLMIKLMQIATLTVNQPGEQYCPAQHLFLRWPRMIFRYRILIFLATVPALMRVPFSAGTTSRNAAGLGIPPRHFLLRRPMRLLKILLFVVQHFLQEYTGIAYDGRSGKPSGDQNIY